MHLTTPALQQSLVIVHAPPSPTQLCLLTSTQTPVSQNPEQHSKPFAHTMPGLELLCASSVPASIGTPWNVGMHGASV